MANTLDDLDGPKAARSRWRATSWSSLAAARRRRTQELVAWTRTLVWRVPLVAAGLLERLTRGGYVVFHDLAVPRNTSANLDHSVIGPTGVFVIDSKQWTGSVHQGADGLARLNHHPLERTLETVRWEAQPVGQLLGTRTAATVCVHGGHVRGGGLHAQGVAIVPAHLLHSTLGDERVLCDAEVELLATATWTRLHPAA